MNKNIEQALNELEFKIDSKNTAIGVYKGYNVSFVYVAMDSVAPLQFHFDFYLEASKKQELTKMLVDKKIKYIKFQPTDYGMLIGYNGITTKSCAKQLPTVLEEVASIITSFEPLGVGFCPACGEAFDGTESLVSLGVFRIKIDEKCIANINQQVEEENQEFEELPNNYLKGFLGALLGTAVGAVVFYVLLLLGFISALSAAIAVWLGVRLYQKFGGKPNKGMVFIVTATALVGMLVACVLIYISAAGNIASEYGFASSGIQALKDMLTVDEFKTEFYTTLAETAFFSIVVAIWEYISLNKKIARPNKIQK